MNEKLERDSSLLFWGSIKLIDWAPHGHRDYFWHFAKRPTYEMAGLGDISSQNRVLRAATYSASGTLGRKQMTGWHDDHMVSILNQDGSHIRARNSLFGGILIPKSWECCSFCFPEFRNFQFNVVASLS